MKDEYRSIRQPVEGIYRSRNSRFLSFAFPVETVEEVNAIVVDVKKKHHSARHHCFAYRLGPLGDVFRMNDDGEPSGTAGKPIYGQIVSHKLSDILIVVVRYFGGTLLGTGGLISAYKNAAADALEKSEVAVKNMEENIILQFPYEKLNLIMKLIKDFDLKKVHSNIDLECDMTLAVKKGQVEEIRQRLSMIPEVSFDEDR